LAQLFGRLTLVRSEFSQESHQAGINAAGFLLAVFALELPTQQSTAATKYAGHVFPTLAQEALQRYAQLVPAFAECRNPGVCGSRSRKIAAASFSGISSLRLSSVISFALSKSDASQT